MAELEAAGRYASRGCWRNRSVPAAVGGLGDLQLVLVESARNA